MIESVDKNKEISFILTENNKEVKAYITNIRCKCDCKKISLSQVGGKKWKSLSMSIMQNKYKF